MSFKKIASSLKKFLNNQADTINVLTIQDMVDNNSHGTPTYAKIIEASKCKQTGKELITFELFFPRCILAEKNTHRKHSKNTGSSRAIPVLRVLKDIMRSPFKPLFWGANKSGMQSATTLPFWKRAICSFIWSTHRYYTYFTVRLLTKLGLHKQWTNRLMEPHSYVRQVETSDSFENFFDLRYHDDAQPEIILLAALMLKAVEELRRNNNWRKLDANKIEDALNWHLPYILYDERMKYRAYPNFLAKLSAARTARTSYLTQEGVEPKPEKEIETFKKLAESVPIHASPLEHIAYPLKDAKARSRNFEGFMQYRELYETKEFGSPIVIPKV
ncbi:thymidylate synthase [Acinetobacter phage EAb13]|nr:thymidylate synthase [Acinetobacter phage EAb13]